MCTSLCVQHSPVIYLYGFVYREKVRKYQNKCSVTSNSIKARHVQCMVNTDKVSLAQYFCRLAIFWGVYTDPKLVILWGSIDLVMNSNNLVNPHFQTQTLKLTVHWPCDLNVPIVLQQGRGTPLTAGFLSIDKINKKNCKGCWTTTIKRMIHVDGRLYT